MKAFTTLIPVFVTPLFTIYLAGIFTRVHRRSGLVGLLVGGSYGIIALIDRQFYDVAFLPDWLTERWIALSWSIGFTLIPMIVMTLVLGREDSQADEQWEESGWLQRSREELPDFRDEHDAGSIAVNIAAIAVLLICVWVTLGLFW